MSSFRPMRLEDIGHGVAERAVKINGKQRVRGDALSHADLASMATANRNALIENRYISVFPKSVRVNGGMGAEQQTVAAVEGDYHVVAKGFGDYAVIKGVTVLEKATKDDAAAFVAAEEAKTQAKAKDAANGSQEAAAPKKARRKKGSGKRRQRKAPAAAAEPGANGPID